MSAAPFSLEENAGILQLWLDTPRSSVNILSEQAASELEQLLGSARSNPPRAVVFRTRKRDSFVNGVGLMLANSVRGAGDVPRLIAPIQAAYRTVRELEAPTIAAIQGNCYGCGVEFVLQCDHRIAELSFETHFYMTEIGDYLFVPTFGATQDLPGLVGLAKATDLVLWGERWSAEQAMSYGLVDACFESEELEPRLSGFVEDVIDGRVARRNFRADSPADPGLSQRTRERIAGLPPAYRELYSDCFDLLESASGGHPDAGGYAREIAACERSLMRPIAKAAVSFFFIREAAKARSLAGAPPTGSAERVALHGVADFEHAIAERRVRAIEIAAPTDPGVTLSMVRYGDAPPSATAVSVLLEPTRARLEWKTDVIAYVPLFARGLDVVEVAARGASPERARAVELLTRAGFRTIASTVDSVPAIDLMLDAYFAPLRAFVESGGTADDALATLRDFGFVRSPAELAAGLPGRCDTLVHAGAGGVAYGVLEDALLVSLLDFAITSLEKKSLIHPALVDFLAREILDFPLGLTSLCRYLDGRRVAAIVARAASFETLVSVVAIERAAAYVTSGRSFYR